MNRFHRKPALDLRRNLFNSGHIHIFNMPGRSTEFPIPNQGRKSSYQCMPANSPSIFWRQSFTFLSVVTLKSLMYSARLENEETLRQPLSDAFHNTRICPGTFETVRHFMIRRVDACIVSAASYLENFFYELWLDKQ
jgi:hypothetical protein